MLDVSHLNVIMLVFGLPGCGACEDYVPRLKAQAREFEDIDIFDESVSKSKRKVKAKAGTLPVFIYNVDAQDPELQALADQYEIRAMPTTIVLVRPSGALRYEGPISDKQINYVLGEAIKYI
jgi:thiol-disulfide isomerase/thioredoxin